MSEINYGGAAFPRPASNVQDKDGLYIDEGAVGASLRDYFAAKAMQAYITARANIFSGGAEKFDEHVARWSYETADAMIKAREA